MDTNIDREAKMRKDSQREIMRRIFRASRGDHNLTIKRYAEAERGGEARRNRNAYGLSSEDYAAALLRDGLAKGWLRL